MQLNDKEQKHEICYFILAYLVENPDAGDTFDGIVEWWLLRQRIKHETRVVSEAVAQLVSDGLILEQEKSDSEVIYTINKTREQAIRGMVSELRAMSH